MKKRLVSKSVFCKKLMLHFPQKLYKVQGDKRKYKGAEKQEMESREKYHQHYWSL